MKFRPAEGSEREMAITTAAAQPREHIYTEFKQIKARIIQGYKEGEYKRTAQQWGKHLGRGLTMTALEPKLLQLAPARESLAES